MSTVRTLGWTSLVVLAGHGLQLGYVLLVGAVTDPGTAGRIYEAVAWATGLSVVGRLGLDRLALHRGAERGDRGRWRGLAVPFTATACAGAAGAALLTSWISPGPPLPLAVASTGVAAATVLAALLRSRGRVRLGLLLNLPVIYGAVVAAVAFGLSSPPGVLWAMAVGGGLGAALGFAVLRVGEGPRESGAVSGFPQFWLLGLATFSLSGADIVIAGRLMGDADVAIYTQISRVVQASALALLAVNAWITPRAASMAAASDRAGLVTLLKTARRWSLIGFGAAALPLLLVFAAPVLLPVDLDRAVLLAIGGPLLVGQAVNAAAGPVALVLQAVGRAHDVTRALLVGSGIALPTMIVLGAYFGGAGIAAGGALGLVVWNVLLLLRTSALLSREAR